MRSRRWRTPAKPKGPCARAASSARWLLRWRLLLLLRSRWRGPKSTSSILYPANSTMVSTTAMASHRHAAAMPPPPPAATTAAACCANRYTPHLDLIQTAYQYQLGLGTNAKRDNPASSLDNLRNEFFGPRFSDPSGGAAPDTLATDAAAAAAAAAAGAAAGAAGASNTLGSDDFNGVEWPSTFYRTHQFNLGSWLGSILLRLPVASYHFLLLPVAPSVSCSWVHVDALYTLRDINFRRLLPSPATSHVYNPSKFTPLVTPNLRALHPPASSPPRVARYGRYRPRGHARGGRCDLGALLLVIRRLLRAATRGAAAG